MLRGWVWRVALCLALESGVSFLTQIHAQGAAIRSAPARITEKVDESKLTGLSGDVPYLARAEFDRGRADASLRLTHVRLLLHRSPGQEAALDAYLADLQDKSSPNYQKWLSPEQFGALYGPADSDIATVTGWLESHGLVIEQVAPGRTDIAFSGTVAQVESAFHTQIHNFRAGSQAFTSNTTEPLIPAALAGVAGGIAHLNTIRPRPLNKPAGFGYFDPVSKRLIRAPADARPGARPELTTNPSSGVYHLYITPADAATIYDSPNSWNANFSGSSEYDGSRVSIGIGGDAVINTNTAGNYGMFINGGYTPSVINVDGVTSTGDSDEAYLDVELSKALAPGAAIMFYTSTDLYSAIERAINDNHVDIFSLSFGLCELGLTTSGNAYMAGLWQQAAAQGIAVTVSTGDDGSAGCDYPTDKSGNYISSASQGLQVSGFASTPYNVAVGGTDFYALPGAFTTYASTTDLLDFRTALGYIPESTWNNSTTTNGKLANNVAQPTAKGNIYAGSGGVSRCSTNTTTSTAAGTCTSGYGKPSWQQATGVPADGARDLPDVALMAGTGTDAAAWLVCTDDTFTSGGVTYTANCASGPKGFSFEGYGGTSTSAPAFAGILAMVQSRTGFRLGQAAQELYELASGPNASSIFHDVTVGNISVPCSSGTPDCSKNVAGNNFETGYDAAAGYDLATGLGSVDATALVMDWGSATGSAKPTITLTPSATTFPASQMVTVTVTIAGSLGTPTGRIGFTGGGYDGGSQFLVNGSFEFTINGGALTPGTDQMTASYSGDPNYAPATASTTLNVTGPGLIMTPASLTFPDTAVGTSSAPQMVTLKSTGTETVTISAIDVLDIMGGFEQTNNCGTTLAVGASCSVSVTFAPALAYNGQAELRVFDNTVGSPQGVPLQGKGYTPAPGVSLSSSKINFSGTVVKTTSPVQPLVVTNSGTAALVISGISISGTNAADFAQTNDCTTVAANSNCTINVTFTPSGMGSESAGLMFNDNAVITQQIVDLQGSGIEQGAFSLAATAVALTRGTSGTSTISAVPSGGYTGTITLNSCSLSGLPVAAMDVPTCVITTSTVTVGSSSTSGVVTISSTAPRSALAAGRSGRSEALRGADSIAFAAVLALWFPRLRRWRSVLILLLGLVGVMTMPGCGGGGGSSSGGGDSGTTPGSYSYTVTGKDALGVKQTVTVSVTVN